MLLKNEKYIGDAKFQKILTKVNCGLDIYNMRSMISGYIWGLDLIMPTKVIEFIPFEMVDGDESKSGPQSEEDIEFFSGFMALWNQFATNNTKKVRKIRPLPKNMFDPAEVLRDLMKLNNDVSMFMEAMEQTNTIDSVGFDNLDIKMMFIDLDQIITEIDEVIFKFVNKKNLSEKDHKEMINIFCINRFRWSEIYHILAKALKEFREGFHPEQNFQDPVIENIKSTPEKEGIKNFGPLSVVPPSIN